MGIHRATALPTVTALALAACSSSSDSDEGSKASASSSASSTKPSPTDSGPDEITLAFAGDTHFQDRVSHLATDPDGLESLKPTLGAADFAMLNLETALTERGAPIPKMINFRAPASSLDTLDNAGIDIVSLANNHAVDYGPDGLEDTLEAKKDSPIPIVGIGADEDEAFEPAEVKRGNVSIGVIGATQVKEETLENYSADESNAGVASNLPTDRTVEEVKKMTKKYDLVVVYLHWGFDYQNCPDERSIKARKDLEEAGADVIVGAHAHRFQGAGWSGKSYVGHGLGNFVWYSSRPYDKETGVLTLTVDAKKARAKRPADRTSTVVTEHEWTPMVVGDQGLPEEQNEAETERLMQEWDNRRECAGLDSTP